MYPFAVLLLPAVIPASMVIYGRRGYGWIFSAWLCGFALAFASAAIVALYSSPDLIVQASTLGYGMPAAVLFPFAGIWFGNRLGRYKSSIPSGIIQKEPIRSHLRIHAYVAYIALSVALCGFLFMSDYSPKLGLLDNVMRGEFRALCTSKLPTDQELLFGPFADLVPMCKLSIPYRYVLAVCILLAGASLMLGQKRAINEISSGEG